MVRSSGQPATAASTSSNGGRNSRSVRRCRAARLAPGGRAAEAGIAAALPASATAQPLQRTGEAGQILLGRAAAGQRRMHRPHERARHLIVAPAGDGRGAGHGALQYGQTRAIEGIGGTELGGVVEAAARRVEGPLEGAPLLLFRSEEQTSEIQ